LHSIQGAALTGLPPFAVLFIELLFVFKNLWQDKSGYYYVFGFLSAVSTIVIITVSEVTIIATHSQLCAEVSDSAFDLCIMKTNRNRTITGGGRAS
jgi:transmembrane 9 superfamily protein 2/4